MKFHKKLLQICGNNGYALEKCVPVIFENCNSSAPPGPSRGVGYEGFGSKSNRKDLALYTSGAHFDASLPFRVRLNPFEKPRYGFFLASWDDAFVSCVALKI